MMRHAPYIVAPVECLAFTRIIDFFRDKRRFCQQAGCFLDGLDGIEPRASFQSVVSAMRIAEAIHLGRDIE